MDEERLPLVDPELVLQCQEEYQSFFNSGTQEELDAARFRLVWSQVHSTDLKHAERGSSIARAKLQDLKDVRLKDYKEYAFLLAVACYRLGKYVEARRLLKQVLQAHPDFHQADHLRSRVDEQIMREGLWGVGVGTAVLGVGLAVLFGSRR
ncbi:hypothetical protein DUNSADRAFT_14320 [Dunaliella salina]|uniref:Mitochondrial fission 1 protein n=1 Tax=Dunaliella salina TaxID=3046 RepID=A0ABQ7G7K8_DUNSA|nr:hypothetical protein DUNSADRAFT_14320 [Dunaliella salina]|eukprot:KAF5830590.1 hypothetical protein DUNSADRAFT_14320 [Dunaliella salina]